MPRRKSNLGRRTRGAEAVRRVIANQTEEERALANEQNRKRMAQIRAEEAAEQRAARLEDARLRARRLRSAASDLLRSQQNERNRLRVAERRKRETANQRQTRLRAQQSRMVKMSSESNYALLHTGQKMPLVGLGTWKSEAGQVKEAVKYALSVGYRHVDCATAYSNEAEIGDAFLETIGADKNVKREELFVTSKLWNTKHHPEDVEPALKKSLEDLKLDYLDLYLMHWPHAFERGSNLFPKNPDGTMRYDNIDYKETWKAMEKLVAKGLAKAIGLSNFNSRQIDDVLSIASVKPAVLQVECHPYLAQNELIAHCHQRGLVVTAYSPLGSPDRMWKHPDEPVLLEEPGIKKLVEKYSKSPAQILLRWQVQRKVAVIPKSVTPARILQNLQVFDFSLTAEEMSYIGSLNKNWRYIVPMVTVDGKLVARDAGHPLYPFNEPF